MEVRSPRGPVYRVIDGFTIDRYFSVELVRSALRYKPRPDDIFLVTFPKSGTVWLQQIGYLIFHDGVPAPSGLEFYKSSPFLEMFGAEDVEKMARPGFIKTHLNYGMIPKSANAKYVWVCRNPKDVCVSFFYHTKSFTGYDFSDGKFEDYFEVFLHGANDFGDYFDYVLSWYAHRNDPNVHLIHYEELKTDPRSEVLKLAAFLGKKYHRSLTQEPELLERILRFSTIDYMKDETAANIKAFFESQAGSDENLGPGIRHYLETAAKYPRNSSYIRKGVLGDWKNHFTDDMNARLEKKIYDKLSGTEFIDLWKSHGIL
uniref:Putative sulfotransferase ixodes scapularis sulfotransferase n=1 Tax=Amblyomma cajennense TaxID=34607 RepID=A0A023FKG4_AMBCJ